MTTENELEQVTMTESKLETQDLKEMGCARCGKGFTKKAENHKYCSDRCRVKNGNMLTTSGYQNYKNIDTNQNNTVLYTGVASNLKDRMESHTNKHDSRDLPNSDTCSDCLVRLPLFIGLKTKDVNLICENI